MKKVYVKPEVTKVELEEKHSVTMANRPCKSGDIPTGGNLAAFPCVEEIAPGSYGLLGGGMVSGNALNCGDSGSVNTVGTAGGIKVRDLGLPTEFIIVDS